jgi:hypothetical protein
MTKDYTFEKQRRFASARRVAEYFSGLSVQHPRGIRWSAVGLRQLADRLALVAIIAVGAFLRMWQLNSLGFNSDEAVYAGQGAAIAADPTLKEIFPIFRAHPLLFQFVLALGFHFSSVSDLLGRMLSVVFGLATLYLIYQLGALLYGRKAGLIAALFVALMPYHVIVTRQVLLDGPMVLFSTLALYMLARFATTQHPAWLYAAGASMGLTFLTKETGLVLIGAIFVFLSLCPMLRIRIRDLVGAMICMVCVIAPHFITLALVGRTSTAQQFLLWQLFRRSNHEWDFYASTVPFAVGPLVILAALLGLWLLRRQQTWRETLLIAWVLVPTVFFQLWPVKGFQYLLPAAPAIAILAARALGAIPKSQLSAADDGDRPARWQRSRIAGALAFARRLQEASLRALAGAVRPIAAKAPNWLQPIWRPLAVVVIACSLLASSWITVNTVIADEFIAGTGGIPGGRAAGEWIRDNVPQGAKLVAIGPSMANIIQFYGHRRTYGLSVSTNPLHRNPVYEPVVNPDKLIRSGELQYFIYDVYSEARSAHFSASLLKYVRRYHGRVVHTESVTVTAPDGTTSLKPIIVIYEVRP